MVAWANSIRWTGGPEPAADRVFRLAERPVEIAGAGDVGILRPSWWADKST